MRFDILKKKSPISFFRFLFLCQLCCDEMVDLINDIRDVFYYFTFYMIKWDYLINFVRILRVIWTANWPHITSYSLIQLWWVTIIIMLFWKNQSWNCIMLFLLRSLQRLFIFYEKIHFKEIFSSLYPILCLCECSVWLNTVSAYLYPGKRSVIKVMSLQSPIWRFYAENSRT